MNLPTKRQQLGKLGEDLAVTYLQKQGFKIIDRNFKKRYGELDIVALDGLTLVYIEVKTRIGHAFGLPEEAVTPRKLREVKHTTLYYKMLHPELPDSLRIDVIGIELDQDYNLVRFNHIPNVTL